MSRRHRREARHVARDTTVYYPGELPYGITSPGGTIAGVLTRKSDKPRDDL